MLLLLSDGSVGGGNPSPPHASLDVVQITADWGNTEFPSVHEILMKPAVVPRCSTRLKGNNRLSVFKPNMSDHDPGIWIHGALKDMCHYRHGYTITGPRP